MLVSIVIPHFERLELIKETLRSLHAQTLPSWEGIIVDDGSCRSTYEQLCLFNSEQVKVYQRQSEPKGPSACRNIGLRAASGDLVIFLDSDDLLAPNCIEERLKKATTDKHLEMWVFPVELFRSKPGDMQEPWNDMCQGCFPDALRRFLASDPPWCVTSTLWRREALERLGGFNEAIMYGDDADLHIRALLSGIKYQQYPDAAPDAYIRRSDTSRITNSCSGKLLESRRTRLREGTSTLKNLAVSVQLQQIWEGQYFVEGEFLAFTQNRPQHEIESLKKLWITDYPNDNFRIQVAYCYLRLCCFFRQKCYFVVRLARRIAMLLFPREWFPSQLNTK